MIRGKGIICSTLWNKLFHAMEQSVPPYGTNRKAAPSYDEGTAEKGIIYLLLNILFTTLDDQSLVVAVHLLSLDIITGHVRIQF